MRLQIGDEFRDPKAAQPRGSAPDRPAYRVTGVVRETQWYGLYEGKKLFTNYHFGKRRLEEAGEQEGLDVFLKTVHYSALNDREHIKDIREQAFFELRRVLGRGRQTRRAEDSTGRVLGQPLSNLLPEPIDYLQVLNERDVFAVPNPRQITMYEPILVFERIHGLDLETWLRDQKPSLLRKLLVLADLLDFQAVLHTEGLLLNGLGPKAVWIDEFDRLHYLGSEMIIEAGKQQKQRRLFSAKRYPAGFSPPEFFDQALGVSVASDLYGWAALGCFLITGDDPAAVARQQGHRFAQLDDASFVQLQRELLKLPAASLARVQGAFRVRGSRFVHTWPDGFVNVLRDCLLAEQGERPSSREELVELWSTSRPRTVPAALAVHLGRQVELLLATRDMEPGLDMVVRRGAGGDVPRQHQDGQLIADGPLAAHALDPAPLPAPYYAVFTRLRANDQVLHSAATPFSLLDLAQPAAVLAFAEEEAKGEAEPESLEACPALPQRVALLEELTDATPAARIWLGSTRPLVRRWALRLLEGQLRKPDGRESAQALLLERCVPEERLDLRQAALRALFQGERRPDPALVARAALALAKGNIDDALPALRGLTSVGLEDEALQAAAPALEMERKTPCLECGESVRRRDLDEHLRTTHGYASVDGSMIPYGEALRTLWERMFNAQNEEATARLAELFVERHKDRAATVFSTAFLLQLQQHAASLGPPGSEAAPGPAWERLGRRLSTHELTQRVCRELLRDSNAAYRLLARLALVPGTAARLAGSESTMEVRTSLEALCPLEDLDTHLTVCRRLQAAGVSAKAVDAVVQELEQEREISCPQCGKVMRRREEAVHLRTVHGMYEVDGVRLGWEEALERLATAMLANGATVESANAWVRVASDRLGAAGVTAQLAGLVVREQQRRGVVPPLSAVAGLPQAGDVVLNLLDPAPELALPLFVGVGKKASLTLLERVAPLLGRTTLSEEDRKQATAVILTNSNAESGTGKRAVDQFVEQADPLTAVRLLEDLEQVVGRNPVIEARRRLARATKLPCPRCSTVLSVAELQDHAWKSHRLVVDGGTLRAPWDVIEECLRSHKNKPDERLITRAVKLAERDDAEGGPARLGRLARRLGVRHPQLPGPGWLVQHRMELACIVAALLALLAVIWMLGG